MYQQHLGGGQIPGRASQNISCLLFHAEAQAVPLTSMFFLILCVCDSPFQAVLWDTFVRALPFCTRVGLCLGTPVASASVLAFPVPPSDPGNYGLSTPWEPPEGSQPQTWEGRLGPHSLLLQYCFT